MKNISKALLSVFICVALASISYGQDRPTIDSLVNKKIYIETSSAGYAFTLKKSEGAYKVQWEEFGSGRPLIKTNELVAKVNGKYQFQFKTKRKEKVNDIVVSLGEKGELLVYADSIRIKAGDKPQKKAGKPEKNRQTLDSLIGKTIRIDNGWAGYGFTLEKLEGDYKVQWEEYGSGRPVIKSEELKVKVNSKLQCQFKIQRKEKVNDIVVSLDESGKFSVYLDGMKILTE